MKLILLVLLLFLFSCIETPMEIKEGHCYCSSDSHFVKVLKIHKFGVSYNEVSANYNEYNSFKNFRYNYSEEIDCTVFQEKK